MDHDQSPLKESNAAPRPAPQVVVVEPAPADEQLIRVMALHALAYCERLFYLEEVEKIRVADDAVYAGRTLHEELAQAEQEAGEWSSLELSSPTLGLVGKTDCLRRRDGAVIPYEHKRGRPRREGKTPVAWPSDALQVSAYGMMLEEETGRTVPEGRIRYHAENATVRVALDETARQAVRQAVARARLLRRSTERPPVAATPCFIRTCFRPRWPWAWNPPWDSSTPRGRPPNRWCSTSWNCSACRSGT